MSKDDVPYKPDDPALPDAKQTEEASRKAKEDSKEQELEEGLEESMSGSDAPASTRRSSTD